MRAAIVIDRLTLLLVASAAAALASGCRVAEIRQQAQTVESAGRVAGTVTAREPRSGQLVVVLFRKTAEQAFVVQNVGFAAVDGGFEFAVPPGEYYLAAFQDRNGDSRYQADEPGSFHGAPTALPVAVAGAVEVSLEVPAQSAPLVHQGTEFGPVAPILRNIGLVTTLEDPRFARENAALGMWRPADFLAGPEGGLFLLQAYDARRTPVLFVHGINGTPLDFAAAIAGLDRGRYQPWVLYYPSGLRLDMVSDYLVTAVYGLQRRHGFTQFALVAHSMGGLVARSFVHKYTARQPQAARALQLFVTVNSPMGGMASAASGVEHAPVVVPSWEDVATGSTFLQRLATDGWPAQVPYHLVFSYSGDHSGDGTVSLDSQLPARVQAEATRLYGFHGTHVGTLSNPEFIALLERLLAGVNPAVAGTP